MFRGELPSCDFRPVWHEWIFFFFFLGEAHCLRLMLGLLWRKAERTEKNQEAEPQGLSQTLGKAYVFCLQPGG